MRLGEALVDDDLVRPSRLRRAAETHIEPVERGSPMSGSEMTCPVAGSAKVRYVEQRELGDARLDGGNAGDLCDLIDKSLWRAPDHGKDVGKAVALVICPACLVERPVGADGQDERRNAAADHERDGKRLRPQPPQVAKQLDVERTHRITTSARRRLAAFRSCGSSRSGRRRRTATRSATSWMLALCVMMSVVVPSCAIDARATPRSPECRSWNRALRSARRTAAPPAAWRWRARWRRAAARRRKAAAGKWCIRASRPTTARASSGRIGASAISVTSATFSYAVRLGIRL